MATSVDEFTSIRFVIDRSITTTSRLGDDRWAWEVTCREWNGGRDLSQLHPLLSSFLTFDLSCQPGQWRGEPAATDARYTAAKLSLRKMTGWSSRYISGKQPIVLEEGIHQVYLILIKPKPERCQHVTTGWTWDRLCPKLSIPGAYRPLRDGKK